MKETLRETLRKRAAELKPAADTAFLELALEIYELQALECKPYSQWISSFSGLEPNSLQDIPRLHISAFKCQNVVSRQDQEELTFTSSGTTGAATSKHMLFDSQSYLDNASRGFSQFYGPVSELCILGLLPSYLERTGSSLVFMVEHFINQSSYDSSGMYLHDHQRLFETLQQCKMQSIPTVLIGVSFGLLDFIEHYHVDFPNLVVMETGGMKGRREEISRNQLHTQLQAGFGVEDVHSEYGMTELLSQAYSQGNGRFRCTASMRVFVTDINDPLTIVPYGTAGLLNIVDLANIDSCSFIMTDDLGIVHRDGTFEIIGRLDESDIRGCNLMVADL